MIFMIWNRPESWVHKLNPCKLEKFRGQYYPDLLVPILSPVIDANDFHQLDECCDLLFQNPQRPDLQTKYLYAHLRTLEPELGLQLSTIHMLKQGYSGGDLTRMAANILGLNRLQQLMARENAMHQVTSQQNKELIQVVTLSTDDFIIDPGGMVCRFLDFCFGGNFVTLMSLRRLCEGMNCLGEFLGA
jgi:hypothetical protein